MTTEERENERQENEALKSAKEIAKKKNKDKLQKIIWNAIKAALVPIFLFLLKLLIIIFAIIGILALIVSVFDNNNKNINNNRDNYYDLRESGKISNLQAYLRQFSHEGEAPMSSDGKYYKMYGDGVGWPTIGNADLQWKSHQSKFARPGKVLQNGEEKTVENVQNYVNGFLTRGSDAEYSNDEIEAMNIYVEKELVDEIGSSVCETYYNTVLNSIGSIELSDQQLFALTAISYNFGHLPDRNGYTFEKVYFAGAAQYEINSWEHNRFIWDNWWSYLGGGAAGHIPARDAAFETYVKGVYDFSTSPAGTVFNRSYYIYYTQEQLDMFDYAPNKPITRDINNQTHEIEIFTYNENPLTVIGNGDILQSCEEVMIDLLNHNVRYSLENLCWNNIRESNDFSKYQCCCATYVTVVLYRAGILEEGYINGYNYNWTGPLDGGGVNTMLRDAGWKRITNPEDAQPGDVCVYYLNSDEGGHTFIYAGDNAIWDETCGVISTSGKEPKRGTANLWNYYRNICSSHGVPLYIWRMP